MAADPYNSGEMSVTFKADGKDGTWVVIKGTAEGVRAQIITLFGFEDEAADTPLYDLIHEATRLYKATALANRTLGGRVLRPGAEQAQSAPASSGSAFAAAAADPGPTPEEKAKAEMLEQIEAQPNIAELKKLWAKNQSVFEDKDLMDAYMAKGGALKAAGAL